MYVAGLIFLQCFLLPPAASCYDMPAKALWMKALRNMCLDLGPKKSPHITTTTTPAVHLKS